MEKPSRKTSVTAPARMAPLVLALVVALLLALSVVRALQTADFDTSYKTGPQYARIDDVIAYTIVAANTGALAQNVVLSDPVPNHTVYVPGSCSYRKNAAAPQTCGPLNRLWQQDLDTGDRITTTLSVQVMAETMNWTVTNCAYLRWNTTQVDLCFITIANPRAPIVEEYFAYLPLITRGSSPDLKITSLTVEPGNPVLGQPAVITVIVHNAGGVRANGFWVDLYDNPDPPPSRANQPWDHLCPGPLEDCYGIAWLVRGGLNAGESLALVSTGGYEADQTHWHGYFSHSRAHDLYAFVDSWNEGVWYGGVEEEREGLDNRYGPLSIDVAPGATGAVIRAPDHDLSIPPRSNPH